MARPRETSADVRRSRASAGPEGTQTFPATSGTVTGWIGLVAIVGLLVTLVATDRSVSGLRWAVAMLIAALLVYAFLVRPRIAVRARTLVLINPLEDVEIPLGIVDEFQIRSATVAHVGRKKYVGVAVGRKVRTMIRGQSETSPALMPRRVRPVAPEPTPALGTIDLLEHRVSSSRADAKRLGETDGVVRRTPVWWLIGSLLVLVVVLVLLLVL